MFQFTTTNVINSLTDVSTGENLFAWDAAKNTLYIKRIGKFEKDHVDSIYRAEATPVTADDYATVEIAIADDTFNKGDAIRLDVLIGLTLDSHVSYYSNDMIFKGKPFSIDINAEEDAAKTVKKFVDVVRKYQLAVYGDKLIKVEAKGTSGNDAKVLVIKATDEFQRIRRANIDKFIAPQPYEFGEYETVIEGEVVKEGTTGFGTYGYVMRNLRLPTNMRTRAFAPNLDENPIIGSTYNQYTLTYTKDRGTLGTNAVGDQVTSKTTHVFFVNQNVDNLFKTQLANLVDAFEGDA